MNFWKEFWGKGKQQNHPINHIFTNNPCSEIMQNSTLKQVIGASKHGKVRRTNGSAVGGNSYNQVALSKEQLQKMREDIQKSLDEMKQAEQERVTKLEKFVDGLFNVGWIVNYKYIQDQKREKAKLMGESYNPDDVDMEVMVSGKYDCDHHLISPCSNYTVRVNNDMNVVFWQKNPEWIKLTEQDIGRVQFTDKGIKVGILKIELDK